MSNSLENRKSNTGSATAGQTLKLSPAPAQPSPAPVHRSASTMPALGQATPASSVSTVTKEAAKPPVAKTSPAPEQSSMPSSTPPAQPVQPTNANSKDIAFRSENIGQWAARQENPFAEQNRQTAARKKKQKENLRKARPYALIAIIVAAIIGAALLLITLIASMISHSSNETPIIAGDSAEDVNSYKDLLHQIYQNNNNSTESVDKAVDKTLETANGKEYEDEVRLAQMMFYQDNNQPEEVNQIGETIQPNDLSPGLQLQYYNSLYYVAMSKHDSEKANEYLAIIYNIANQLGGDGA